MGVIGSYTPATNFRIRSVFLGDSGFDTNTKGQSIFWEFKNANYYHALAISDYKLAYIVETNVGGGVWQRKELDIDLDGVGVGAYSYYKDAIVDITIDTVWDFDNKQLRIYVDGYLLWKMTQQNPINIIAVNQLMQLSTGLEPVYYSFSGTITVTYAAVNTPTSTTADPTVKAYWKKDFHPLYIPGSQNWLPVPDILLQIQAWPDMKADPSANFWIGVAYNIAYVAGSNGGYPIPMNIVNKAMAVTQQLVNKLRHEVRVLHGHLQTFVTGDFLDPNSLDRALIALANANPQVSISFGSVLAQTVVPPTYPTPPNLNTMPFGTPNASLIGYRDTLFDQLQKLLSLLTRPINSNTENDETVNHCLGIAGNTAQYVSWILYMEGKMRSSLPPSARCIVYDVFDLYHCVSSNPANLTVNPMVQVNTTGQPSMSMYPENPKFTYKWQGAKRGLQIGLKSKIYELLGGYKRNDYFVSAGWLYEEQGVRPGPYLGYLKALEVMGNDRFQAGYFTPKAPVGIQNEKGYFWQFASPSFVKAVCSRPDIRAILDNGDLLPGDVREFPSIPTSQKMFMFDCGNKLVIILAKKWAGQYIISASLIRLSNWDTEKNNKTVTFNLEGENVTVTARWQGSLYKRDINGNMEQFDDWHEDSEWNWWANTVIITNNGNDMAGINDMGNGIGFLYQVAKDGTTILSTEFNNVDGMRTMRELAVIDAPMAFNRSSTGIIHITSVAGAGTIDDVEVDGNSLLGSPYSVGTSNPTTEAEGLAAAINAYTPSAGYVYKAFNIAGDVYLQSPLAAGAATNDLTIIVTVSTNTIVTSTEAFHDGSTSNNNDYDELSGRRYFLNADYNSNGVPDTVPAVRTSLLYAIEITKYVNMKGLQGGMPSKALSVVNDALINTDRNAVMTNMLLSGESGADDVLVYIAPDGYVEGDLVFLRNILDGTSISVESAPTTTSPSFYKNIFLDADAIYELDNSKKSIVLQYQYDIATSQGIFVEKYRSMAGSDCKFVDILYADAVTLAGNAGLTPCSVYNITDKNIVVRAKSTTEFWRNAIFIADYTGSGKVGTTEYEDCIYNFALDIVTERTDVRGNYVRNAAEVSSLIPWGYPNVLSNTHIDSQAVTMVDDNTTINRCVFQNAEIVALESGSYLYGCEFIKTRGNITINGFSFTNRSYNGTTRKSTFDIERNPDGNGNIELGDEWYCGVIICSGLLNVLEQICRTDGVYTLMWHEVSVGQKDGAAITIVNKNQASLSSNPNLIFSQTYSKLNIQGIYSQLAVFRFQNDSSADHWKCFVYNFEDPTLIATITSDTTIAEQTTVFCDATGGVIVVTLPLSASVLGKTVTIKKIDASGNTVTITPSGGELIEGAANQVLSTQYDFYQIQTDGYNWFII